MPVVPKALTVLVHLGALAPPVPLVAWTARTVRLTLGATFRVTLRMALLPGLSVLRGRQFMTVHLLTSTEFLLGALLFRTTWNRADPFVLPGLIRVICLF